MRPKSALKRRSEGPEGLHIGCRSTAHPRADMQPSASVRPASSQGQRPVTASRVWSKFFSKNGAVVRAPGPLLRGSGAQDLADDDFNDEIDDILGANAEPEPFTSA